MERKQWNEKEWMKRIILGTVVIGIVLLSVSAVMLNGKSWLPLSSLAINELPTRKLESIQQNEKKSTNWRGERECLPRGNRFQQDFFSAVHPIEIRICGSLVLEIGIDIRNCCNKINKMIKTLNKYRFQWRVDLGRQFQREYQFRRCCWRNWRSIRDLRNYSAQHK